MSEIKNNNLASSPFIPSPTSVGKIMRSVIYALIPGIAIYILFFGWGVLINILLAIVASLLFEWFMLVVCRRPVRVFLFDGSAIITAILLALALPTIAPWWIPVVGSFFAIVVAKHLYGGLGYNVFNPAMAAYAVLLISFPLEMTLWSVPLESIKSNLGFLNSINFSFYRELPPSLNFDAITSATILDQLRTEIGLGHSIEKVVNSSVFGFVAGAGYEWVNLGFLAGGLWLIYRKIITWHIPVAMLLGLLSISTFCYLLDAEQFSSPWIHLFGGASILGAFFIATDPITASTTEKGRLIYGFCIGLLVFSIRAWGGYPDGVAFAVLLIGLTVPLLDHYTAPKVYGARKGYDKN